MRPLANGARDHAPEDGPILPAHELAVACERDVVHRDDGGARTAKGHGVLRVHEVGADRGGEACGSVQAMRSSCEPVESTTGSTPSGTRSGRRVTATSRTPASGRGRRARAEGSARRSRPPCAAGRARRRRTRRPSRELAPQLDDGVGRALPGEATRPREAGGHELVAPRRARRESPRAIADDVERVDEDRRTARRPPPSPSPTDVTTGVPHAIASSTGRPKPSYNDG